jgi:hypothetical protein
MVRHMSLTMSPRPLLDPTDPAVAARLARLLTSHRKQRGWSLRHMSKLSEGTWSVRDLRAAEDGRWSLDQGNFADLAALYEVDVTPVLPQRTPLVIDKGLVSIGAMASTFSVGNTDSLLKSYLLLVRRMRGQKRVAVVDLRRADLQVLATYLELDAEIVSARLGELMGVTAAQRTSMSLMFTTGTAVIVLTSAIGIASTSQAPSGSINVPVDDSSSDDSTTDDDWASSAIDDITSGQLSAADFNHD